MNNNTPKNVALGLGIILFLGGLIYMVTTAIQNGVNEYRNNVSSIQTPKSESISTTENSIDNQIPKLTKEQKSNCSSLTPQVTPGPFYISNTPLLFDDNLNFTSLPGIPMYLYGTVYAGTDEKTPLADAKIEIWQADEQGKYYPQSGGDYNSTDKSTVALRGYITTDESGEFSYTSIFPGEYEGRSRHVHYRISKEGYKTLTTQLTFYINNDKTKPEEDNISQLLLDCQNNSNIKPDDGEYNATYDFRLEKL